MNTPQPHVDPQILQAKSDGKTDMVVILSFFEGTPLPQKVEGFTISNQLKLGNALCGTLQLEKLEDVLSTPNLEGIEADAWVSI